MEILLAVAIVAVVFFVYRARGKRTKSDEIPGGIEISVQTPPRPSKNAARQRYEQNPALEKLVHPEDPRVEKWVGWNFCARIQVAGIQFKKQNALYAYKKYGVDSDVSLVRDPLNEYDKNAIEVLFGDKSVGFIDREVATMAAKYLSDDMPIRAKYKKGWLSKKGFLELHIQPLMPDATSRKTHGWTATPRKDQN